MVKVSTLVLLFLAFVCSVSEIRAQTTEFTFQGSLKDNTAAANGNYDFEFALFDALVVGNQIGATIPKNNHPVANGIFSVKLDFGSEFPGANRFLEIRVRLSGQPGFTTLAPRQLLNSAPYSVKSLKTDTAATATNALQLGGVAGNQYVVTSDPRMTDARIPLPGSSNYIQNIPTQQNADLHINGTVAIRTLNTGDFGADNVTAAGNGTFAGTLSGNTLNINGTATIGGTVSASQYNIGAQRMLSAPGAFNLFVGRLSGRDNIGFNNVFVGDSSGVTNTNGGNNAFFGYNSGQNNTTGSNNAFFGAGAGSGNTAGSDNNSFFGQSAGRSNSASDNAFFGMLAGENNFSGVNNSFFGKSAGSTNDTGAGNTIIGALANVLANDLSNASAIGSRAVVSQSNSLVLGSIAGVNGADADTKVGIGTTAPVANLEIRGTQPPTSFGVGISAAPVLRVIGTKGGDGATGSGGDGAQVLLQAGDGGNGIFGNSGNGGSIVLLPGFRGGFGQTLGVPGSVILAPFAGNNVGVGTVEPGYKLDVVGRSRFKQAATDAGTSNSAGFWFFQNTPNADQAFIGMENDNSVGLYGNNGGNWGLVMNTQTGVTSVRQLGAAGATALCRNASNEISTCSSSLRYKSNISGFLQGMSFVNQLRPIAFDWKDGGMKDVGFGAEEIAQIDSRFVTYNDKGEIEGVKYDRLSVAFVNAFKEQQVQIEIQKRMIESQQLEAAEQKTENRRLQSQMDEVKKVVCTLKPDVEICKEK